MKRIAGLAAMTAALLAGQGPVETGAQVCTKCHAAQAGPQPATSMGHALETPADCRILKSHRLLTFQSGAYSYKIVREGERSIYSVSDGHDTVTAEIQYAFGLGSAGQTYVYTLGGQIYQSRVSFYTEIDGLDPTIGASNESPKTLIEAAGRIMDRGEQAGCFGCHSTGGVNHQEMQWERLEPGVRCEHCHGSAESHVAKLAPMKSLRHMSAETAANFCGQCHRTWDDIASAGITGVVNVRFQPYRLTNSKCFDSDDGRIACTTCHDPHREVDANAAHYASKCLSCHGAAGKGKRCPRGGPGCVTCHMPKIEIPGAHKRFTDHEIRIVRANERYPN